MTIRIPPRPHHEPIPRILRHVHRLTRSFVRDGQRISYIHVYARPLGPGPEPDLKFITAQESGFEGIACVDNVARAAILALHVHEETGSAVALRLARDWFIMLLQHQRRKHALRARGLHARTSAVVGPLSVECSPCRSCSRRRRRGGRSCRHSSQSNTAPRPIPQAEDHP
jgi:hypothetical protein